MKGSMILRVSSGVSLVKVSVSVGEIPLSSSFRLLLGSIDEL